MERDARYLELPHALTPAGFELSDEMAPADAAVVTAASVVTDPRAKQDARALLLEVSLSLVGMFEHF